jgi:hypothetical protein
MKTDVRATWEQKLPISCVYSPRKSQKSKADHSLK